MIDKIGKYLVYTASVFVILYMVWSIFSWSFMVTQSILSLHQRVSNLEKTSGVKQ